MHAAFSGPFDRPRIVVADEDPVIVALVIDTLRKDGHAVFHAYDALSAAHLAFSLDTCHLLISNSRVDGLPGVELIRQLRHRLPNLPILYLASIARSSSAVEAQLPSDVPILREPFTAEELRAVVQPFLPSPP